MSGDVELIYMGSYFKDNNITLPEIIKLKYDNAKLLEFVKGLAEKWCDIIPENCRACDATKILREIGEDK